MDDHDPSVNNGGIRWRLPCQEEAIADELLIAACICLTKCPPHWHKGSAASLYRVLLVIARVIVMSSNINKQAAATFRLHKPPIRLWCLGALVEDEVQIDGADREWKADFGRGVGRQNMAALGVGSDEVLELVDISDKQGAVVVEDVEDLESILLPIIAEVWNAVVAMDLEAQLTAFCVCCLLRNKFKWL